MSATGSFLKAIWDNRGIKPRITLAGHEMTLDPVIIFGEKVVYEGTCEHCGTSLFLEQS